MIYPIIFPFIHNISNLQADASPNLDFSNCLNAITNFALPRYPLFTPIKNRLLPSIIIKVFHQLAASFLWHYNCFFPLDRMQALSIFFVRRPDATKTAFGLKKEAQPKFSHRNDSKVWLHPAKSTGGAGDESMFAKAFNRILDQSPQQLY